MHHDQRSKGQSCCLQGVRVVSARRSYYCTFDVVVDSGYGLIKISHTACETLIYVPAYGPPEDSRTTSCEKVVRPKGVQT